MRLLVFFFACVSLAWTQAAGPLQLENKIQMSNVQGRIDHMSIDIKGRRLFVAALGNNTVEVIDLKSGKRVNGISGLSEPQGVLYLPDDDRLYVASGKDGTLRVFDGSSLKALKTIRYGDDADNVRYDVGHRHIYVGYGSGALGELDKEGRKIAEIKLDAHPESFQLEKNGPRIYANLPKARKIDVVDRETRSIIATWRTGGPLANYPMALDEANQRLFIVCRFPARLVILDTKTGEVVQTLPAVGDCDDVFYDQMRRRIYASGGEGAISVFQQENPDHYKEIARVGTAKGARTSLFSAELNRFYVAARRQGSQSANIEVFEPKP